MVMCEAMQRVRGEPDYADQVPRREAYERDHPEVLITCDRGMWRALVPGRDKPLVQVSLRYLLDQLESL